MCLVFCGWMGALASVTCSALTAHLGAGFVSWVPRVCAHTLVSHVTCLTQIFVAVALCCAFVRFKRDGFRNHRVMYDMQWRCISGHKKLRTACHSASVKPECRKRSAVCEMLHEGGE